MEVLGEVCGEGDGGRGPSSRLDGREVVGPRPFHGKIPEVEAVRAKGGHRSRELGEGAGRLCSEAVAEVDRGRVHGSQRRGLLHSGRAVSRSAVYPSVTSTISVARFPRN